MDVALTLDHDRYHLFELLGEGGMASVYRAHDTRLGVERAIKVLSPSAVSTGHRRRFENEARTMARLAHPAIVTVVDVVEDDTYTFMVMELVEGGTLWDWVEVHGPMPPRLALQHLRPVLDAMAVAHEAGVIHRDIKPQNIMLTVDGRPKITDFGIAHVRDIGAEGLLTRTGAVLGTWGYMSPEQRQSTRDVDARADIYALGATLFALVTGEAPVDLFVADQDETLLEKVPEEVRDLVARATRYRAVDRFPDVASLIAEVDRHLELLPPLPRDLPVLGRRAVRGQGRVTTGGRASTPFRPVPYVAPVPNTSATFDVDAVETSEPDLRPEPRRRSPWILGLLSALSVALGAGWLALAPDRGPGAPPPAAMRPGAPSPVSVAPPAGPPPPAPQEVVASEIPLAQPEVAAPAVAPAPALPQAPAEVHRSPADAPATASPPARSTADGEPPPPATAADAAPPPVDPVEVAPAPGRVIVVGEAERVELVAADKTRFDPGLVPPGTYTIEATFAGRTEPGTAGRVTVASGASLVIRCDAVFAKCRVPEAP